MIYGAPLQRITLSEQIAARPYRLFHHVDKPGWEFAHHGHDGICDIDYVVAGRVTHRFGDREITYRAGDLIWIREADDHAISSCQGEFYNLNCSQERLHAVFEGMGVGDGFAALLAQPELPSVAVGRARRSWYRATLAELLRSQESAAAARLLWRYVSVVFLDAFLPTVVAAPSQARPLWFEECLQLVEQRLEEPLTLAALPELCGYSREHIARSFRRYLNTSPSAYLNGRRLVRAALLLRNSSREIMEICYALGFNSPSYFYRLFVRQYGVAPKAYRVMGRTPFS